MLFGKKKNIPTKNYDKTKEKPAILCSICTGEQTAGFRNLRSGKFTGVMLIRSDRDLEEFMQTYGLENEPEKIY